jgi:methylase of polypeptide subunit release factors
LTGSGPVAPAALSAPHTAALRDLFVEHGYTVPAVVEAIGEEAHRALGRNSTVPAVRALADRTDPLATLVRLWLLQRPVPRPDLERALPGLVVPLAAAGVLEQHDSTVRAVLDLRPYDADEPLWVCSDLTPNLDTAVAPIRPDFVLGLSSASTTLAQLTLRRPVGRALDLGTGCGVQSLHLARHAATVVATDLNPRALALARITLDLNGISTDLRAGDLYAPVAGETFDLITTNPPYVLSPPGSAADRLTYREGADPADGLVERVVRQGARHLADDGVLQVLGNWVHPSEPNASWADRLRTWIAPTGCDAHVVQREVLDPSAYVEIWLADAGLTGSADYTARYEAWLDYFDRVGVAGVGLGWITLHRSGHDDPEITVEDWPYAIEQPIAPALEARIDAVGWDRRRSDAEVLARRWMLAADVVEETVGTPGAADPGAIVFRSPRGLRRAVPADTALAGVLGACDGELSLGAIVDAVAGLLDEDAVALRARIVRDVRALALDGLLN